MDETSLDCERVATRLTDYLDKALAPDEHAAMAAHLATCPACGQLLEQLLGTIALLGRLRNSDPQR